MKCISIKLKKKNKCHQKGGLSVLLSSLELWALDSWHELQAWPHAVYRPVITSALDRYVKLPIKKYQKHNNAIDLLIDDKAPISNVFGKLSEQVDYNNFKLYGRHKSITTDY